MPWESKRVKQRHCVKVVLSCTHHVNDAQRVQHIRKSHHAACDARKTKHSLLAQTTLSCKSAQWRHGYIYSIGADSWTEINE